jgi:hypothetical protein
MLSILDTWIWTLTQDVCPCAFGGVQAQLNSFWTSAIVVSFMTQLLYRRYQFNNFAGTKLHIMLIYILLWLKCFSLHKDTTPPQPNHIVTPTHVEPEHYNTWNKYTVSRKLLKMDVLTFETCWAVNSETIKRVTSSWYTFIQSGRNVSKFWRKMLTNFQGAF